MEWIWILLSLIGLPLFTWLLPLAFAELFIERADKRDAHFQKYASELGLYALAGKIARSRKARIIQRFNHPQSYWAMRLVGLLSVVFAFLSALLFIIEIRVSEDIITYDFLASYGFLVFAVVSGIAYSEERKKWNEEKRRYFPQLGLRENTRDLIDGVLIADQRELTFCVTGARITLPGPPQSRFQSQTVETITLPDPLEPPHPRPLVVYGLYT